MFTFAATGQAQQDIPPGVKYKPAPDSVNAAAKLKLEGALANGAAFPEKFFRENGILVLCRPTLWKFLEPSAELFDLLSTILIKQLFKFSTTITIQFRYTHENLPVRDLRVIEALFVVGQTRRDHECHNGG
jgi:hypothetical protein